MRRIFGLTVCCLAAFITANKRVVANSPLSQLDLEFEFAQSVGLHEPVVVILSVHNHFSKSIALHLGAKNQEYFDFSLSTPEHKILMKATHPEAVVVIAGSGTISVQPGQHYRQPILLNQFFPFETAGTYVLTSELKTKIQIVDDGTLSPLKKITKLEVTSRDVGKLSRVCEQLAAEAENARDVEAAQYPTLALSYINDPIAVPYLRKLLIEHTLEYDVAISGLERVGSEDAVEALLSALDDKYGEIDVLARQALSRMQNRISNPNLKETVKRSLSKGVAGQNQP